MKYETYWSMVQVRMLVNDVVNRKGIRCPCCGEQEQIQLTNYVVGGDLFMSCRTCKRDGKYTEFRIL